MNISAIRNILLCVITLLTFDQLSWADPIGRSAAQAEALAKFPQTGWIGHYLPNDRYKLAGGIWTVVSSELDTTYHLPSCPHMLEQRADLVIGFASPKDAEEAGYTMDSFCQHSGGVDFGTDIKDPSGIRLQDKISVMSLPYGWKRIERSSKSQTVLNAPLRYQRYVDAFTGPNQQLFVVHVLDFSRTPGFSSIDFGPATTLQGLTDKGQRGASQIDAALAREIGVAGRTRREATRFANSLSELNEANLGGLPGVKASFTDPRTGLRWLTYLAGRGNKLFLLCGPAPQGESLQLMARSLRPG